MRSNTEMFKFIVLLFILATVGSLRAQGVRIILPRPGEVANTGMFIIAELSGDFPNGRIVETEFQYTRDGATYETISGTAPLGTGDLIPRGSLATLWHTAKVKPGNYSIRMLARIENGRTATSSAIPILVNAQPQAIARAQLISPPNDPQTMIVLLDGTSSHDSDGTIASYTWRFDDQPVPFLGPVIQRQFQTLGAFPLALEVTDDRRGTSTIHYFLTLSRAANGAISAVLSEKTLCGCESMTVLNAGNVQGTRLFEESSSSIPPAEAFTLGPFPPRGSQLNLSTLPKPAKHRFQVVAQLHPGSVPQACAEGQRVQQSVSLNGFSFSHRGKRVWDPRYDPTSSSADFPASDDPYSPEDHPAKVEMTECPVPIPDNPSAPWCDDGYHGGGDARGVGVRGLPATNEFYKEYDGQKRILWLDAPGKKNVTRKDLPLFILYAFDAAVSGAFGGCRCTWNVAIEIDKDGRVTDNELSFLRCTAW